MQRRRLPSFLLAGILISSAPFVSAEIETWTNTEGRQMEAKALGKRGDSVVFQKSDGVRYEYPFAKLSAEDQERLDAQIASGAVPAQAPEPPAAAAPKAPAVRVGSVAGAISDKLVEVENGSLARVAPKQIEGARHLAFYYSAAWCPPCRAFTPDLVTAYNEIKAKHPEFELIFVSSDRDEKAMLEYMSKYNMSWPALRFDQVRTSRAVMRPDNESGIPNLVFMDSDGKEIALSYTSNGKYLGPRSVLQAIKKHYDM